MSEYNGFIYETVNNITGRRYIGRHGRSGDPQDPDDSWYLGSGVAITESIEKYGRENFTRIILDPGPLTLEEAIAKEMYYLNLYDCANNPLYYNLTNTSHEGYPVLKGESHPGYGKPSPFAGRHHTEETKQRISNSLRGRIVSEETRKRLSEALKGHPAHNKGVPMNTDHRNHMIRSLIGRQLSDTHRQHISEVTKGENNPMYGKRGENNPNYGRHHTEETKQIIGINTAGRVWINDGCHNKRVYPEELAYYLSVGYSEGQLKRS